MENPNLVTYADMQAPAMGPVDILGQNLQILGSQQQMLDQQQDWHQHSLAFFKMPKMTKEDDPEAYIEAFEQYALVAGLDKRYWASQLGALVVGKAQATYRALLREDALDYESIKEAILYRLEINPEHYRRQFRAKKGHKIRQPRVLLQQLRVLLDKWVSPVGHDQEALADQIVLEQFQNDLEERTQRWVWQHTPQNCEEALRLAEAFSALEAYYPRERRSQGPLVAAPRELERRRPPDRGTPRDTVFLVRAEGPFFQRMPVAGHRTVGPG
ncbi:hypothetical protein Y1Q_0019603 [Alligator mississippiensis]|uniref:SCAN box domain-containing protein n=1 Tax=Alligator mississippiensis TaxID=8496 RepID=A0A151PEC3_ALLMI|nr:hypothetical protein Y1Q_0019603 [Alligator mississippiensis]